ncbi:uncharacterized protein LOC119687072 [Teleopsis dalmanni]|uniref:uncharacterized protein LOC119687072 n=1 Tax=Teleopsis dalmanni TaxID=139649 RepID=UPI0018CDC44F|nr:uncharacterized protein LOC119687072 [Teleopsis dalmanni]
MSRLQAPEDRSASPDLSDFDISGFLISQFGSSLEEKEWQSELPDDIPIDGEESIITDVFDSEVDAQETDTMTNVPTVSPTTTTKDGSDKIFKYSPYTNKSSSISEQLLEVKPETLSEYDHKSDSQPEIEHEQQCNIEEEHETEQEHNTEQELDTNIQSLAKLFETITITTSDLAEPTSFTDLSLVSLTKSSETSINDEDGVNTIQLDTLEEVHEKIPEEVPEKYESKLSETNMCYINDMSSSSSGKLIMNEDKDQEFFKAVTTHSEKGIIKPKKIGPTSGTISNQSTETSLSFSKETEQMSNVVEDKDIKEYIIGRKIQKLQKEIDPLLEKDKNSSSKNDVRGRIEEGQIVRKRKKQGLITSVNNEQSLLKRRRVDKIDFLWDNELKVSNTTTDECEHLSKFGNEEKQSISINNIKSEKLCNTENNAEFMDLENIIMTETKKWGHREPHKRRKVLNSVNTNSELDTIVNNENLTKTGSPILVSQVGSIVKGECGVEEDQDKNKEEQNESQVGTSVEEKFIQINDINNCSVNVNVTQNYKQSIENLEESSNVSVYTSDLDPHLPEGNQTKTEKHQVPVIKTPEPVDEKSVEISTTIDTEETLETKQNPQMPSKASEKNDFKSSNESVQTEEVPSLNIKSTPKPKAASNWEHFYTQKADDDALIVCRHSNNSYSRTDLNNLSLDITDTPNNNDINSASTTAISENSLVINSSSATASSIKSTPVSEAIAKNNKAMKSNITNKISETGAETTTNVKTIKSNRTKKRVVMVEPGPSTDQNSAENKDNSLKFPKPQIRKLNKKPDHRRKNAVLTPDVTPKTTATPVLASPVSAEKTKVRNKPGQKKGKSGTNISSTDVKNVKRPAKKEYSENNRSEVKPLGLKDAATKQLQNETSEEVKTSAKKNKDTTEAKNTTKVLSKGTPTKTPPVTKMDKPTVAKNGMQAKPPVIPHDVEIKKTLNVAQIIFSTHKARQPHTFTAQMMTKLVEILKGLIVDKKCNCVLILSDGPNFCHGVDFTALTHPVIERRREAAHNLAKATKDYLYTLLTFPKPIIAGVRGSNVGLGVTQLPLFDVVISTNKATYEAPYAKIGQLPEGYCIWNNLPKIRGNFRTKLFFNCDKLHSTEALLSGLVSKFSSTNDLNEVALEEAKKIAAFSPEMSTAMKRTVVLNNLKAVGTQLDAEFDTIIEQWCSDKCFESFRKYIETGHF